MASFLEALLRIGKPDRRTYPAILELPNIPVDVTLQEVTIVLWGMGCPACARLVRNSVMALEGVIVAEVDCFTGIAHITFNPMQTSSDTLVDAAARAGNRKEHRYIVLDVI